MGRAGRGAPGRPPRPAVTLAAGKGPGPCGAAAARQRGQRRPTYPTWRRGLGRLRRRLLVPEPPPPARRAPGSAPQPSSAESLRAARRTGQHGPEPARPPRPAASMGALARALLLPLLAPWLLRCAAAPAPAPFTLPLRVAAAAGRGAAPTPGPGPPAEPRADGLALALEPAGGAANFLAMVDNLQGDSGRGYYLEVLIGTPPQKVGRWAPVYPTARAGTPPSLRSPGCTRRLLEGSCERPAVLPRGLVLSPNRGRSRGLRCAGSRTRALGMRSGGRPDRGAARGGGARVSELVRSLPP